MTLTTTTSQGTLTTSVATLITGVAASEFHSMIFTNYSGSDVTLELFHNGSADVNRVGKAVTLEASGGYAKHECRIGIGDTIRAKASAGTAVAWTDEGTVP